MTDYATLYLSQEDWIVDSEFFTVAGMDLQESDTSKGFYVYKFDKYKLTLNKMLSDSNIREQIVGLSRYVISENIKSPKPELSVKTLENIAKIKSVFGCIIEPGFDKEGKIANVLTNIIIKHNGLMFAFDNVFDSSGKAIFGPDST
jgi:hypothetical protein